MQERSGDLQQRAGQPQRKSANVRTWKPRVLRPQPGRDLRMGPRSQCDPNSATPGIYSGTEFYSGREQAHPGAERARRENECSPHAGADNVDRFCSVTALRINPGQENVAVPARRVGDITLKAVD